MSFKELRNEIEKMNQFSDIKYHAFQKARNKQSEHYNDRKIIIYFENDGFYSNKNRLLPLIEFHEHRFGAIDSTSKYMGYNHYRIFKLVVNYVTKRRSERATITKKYWVN